MYIGVSPACISIWGCQNPWNLSYRQLWVLGIEPRSFGRTASALNLLSYLFSPLKQMFLKYLEWLPGHSKKKYLFKKLQRSSGICL